MKISFYIFINLFKNYLQELFMHTFTHMYFEIK